MKIVALCLLFLSGSLSFAQATPNTDSVSLLLGPSVLICEPDCQTASATQQLEVELTEQNSNTYFGGFTQAYEIEGVKFESKITITKQSQPNIQYAIYIGTTVDGGEAGAIELLVQDDIKNLNFALHALPKMTVGAKTIEPSYILGPPTN